MLVDFVSLRGTSGRRKLVKVSSRLSFETTPPIALFRWPARALCGLAPVGCGLRQIFAGAWHDLVERAFR